MHLFGFPFVSNGYKARNKARRGFAFSNYVIPLLSDRISLLVNGEVCILNCIGVIMREKIHSMKNLQKLGEADMEAIRKRIIEIEKLDANANWTPRGLNELSFYDIDLYRDIPGGAVHFIGGAMATLHRINGPHLV